MPVHKTQQLISIPPDPRQVLQEVTEVTEITEVEPQIIELKLP